MGGLIMARSDLSVVELEAQLEAARAAEAEERRAERVKAEAAAQHLHDRQMAKEIDALEDETAKVLTAAVKAAKVAPVSRAAAAPARGLLIGAELGGGVDRLVEASRHDPAASMLYDLFQKVVAEFNKMSVNRPASQR